MKKIICYLRTIKYTIGRFMNTGEILPYVSGHIFVDKKEYIKGKKKWFVMECEVCGEISKTWMKVYD